MAFTLPSVPGLTAGIPFDQYLQLPGDSSSSLKKLMRSPWAYKWAKDHPEDDGASKSKDMGTAAHTAILEPHRLKTDFMLWEGGERRGKAWTDFKDAYADRQILTLSEFADLKAMHSAVRSYEPAARYLREGVAEVTIQWVDPVTKRKMRGRIDWLTYVDGQWVLVDLKSTRSSNPRKFGSDAYKMGYHIQFSMYVDGFHALLGETPRFVVIAFENKSPFEPAVFDVPGEVLERGHSHYQGLLDTLQRCEATNTWPPALQDEIPLQLPAWAMEDADEDNDLTGLDLTA